MARMALVIIQLLCALCFGAAIGVERQWRQRMAGLRTNALVATGSALFVIVSRQIDFEGDATRMAAQVVSGIGFLGAGVIMRDGFNIRGLNTAATLWCSAAIGVLAGFNLIAISAFGAFLVITANLLLRPVAKQINKKSSELNLRSQKYSVEIKCRSDFEGSARFHLLEALNKDPLNLISLKSKESKDSKEVSVVQAVAESLGPQVYALESALKQLVDSQSHIFTVQWEIIDKRGKPKSN